MHIIAVGDLHGDFSALLRLLDRETVDGLVCVGDWGDAGEVTKDQWETLLTRVPVLTVYGNHDDLDLLPTLRNRDGTTVLLGQAERRTFCGLEIVGVSGIWAKNHRKPFYVTDENVADYAAHIASGGAVDVLLTHGCPLGVADRTPSGRPGGQRCFLDLLKVVRPSVYLCGHLHVAQERRVSDPPCHVLNTGDLPGGSYVRLQGDAGEVQAELVRHHNVPPSP